ncbi:lysyl oxidase family protein [Actinoplanes sp. NPDC051859]|uniref:lysyl oxidase family protein n=1 Tax=Actinoplanes sp. NPDC051859 TaxID=3363909 RepID=UPI0037BA1A99
MTRRTRLWAAGAVAAAVTLAGAGVGVASAAAEPPPLAFTRAAPEVIADRYVWEGQAYIYLDLGIHVIAGKHPFEIRATRASYAKPIKARQYVVKNGKRTAVNLPIGMVLGWNGLKDFTTVSIRNSTGTEVASYSTDFCPNSWNSARTRRDAPAQNPYPRGCAGGNPFHLGAVWGIQAGWNAEVNANPQTQILDLPDGQYQATVALNPRYRAQFKIPEQNATQTVGLTVRTADDGGVVGAGLTKARLEAARAGANTAPRAVAAAHAEHAGQGDPATQIAAYQPGFRPPAKAPKAVPLSRVAKGPRPDLRSLPAWGISLAQEEGRWNVNFGATVWNAGTSPLLVDGFRRTGSELMDAYQYFFDTKGKEVASVKAGTMEWDARDGHRHWHFTDFAQYNLLSADKQLAVRSGKEAFCLANTDAVDYTIPGAKWRPDNTDLSSSCGQNTAVAVREVLDVGSGDTYTQARPGQSFDVTDLPNGSYWIEVKANPVGTLTELSTKNNSAFREIRLGGTAEARTLEIPTVYGLD